MSVYEDDFLQVGKKFGMLTYTGEWKRNDKSVRYFKLRCDCGKEVWIPKSNLKRKNAGNRGCGCEIRNKVGNVYEDELLKIGKRFGMLTYTGKMRRTAKYNQMVELKCECGNTTWKQKGSLKHENAGYFGCGCGKQMRIKDETGNKYGELTVLKRMRNNERGNARWLCKCDCGNETTVRGTHLRSGGTKSCGHTNKMKEETSNKYNRLTVIKRVENDKRGRVQWLCRCDCGNETVVVGVDLRSGHTKSCGCYTKQRIRETHSLPEGVAAFNRLCDRYKKGAKQKNKEFNLSIEEFRVLTRGNCYYCGVEPRQVIESKHNTGDYIYNGIDRVDSNKGYTKENSVSCCKTCNYMKSNLSLEEFKELVMRWCKNVSKW